MVERSHARRVGRVQKQLRHYLERGGARPISQLRRGSPSNQTRGPGLKARSCLLDLSPLNHILRVDPEQQLVISEPGVTMETLARATLRHGFLPQVLPEFRGITVGGAISGAGIESSSHRFGLIHDTLAWCDLLTGSGELRRLSPDSHPRLFAGVAGAYGTLGLILCSALHLVPAKPYVRLQYEHHTTVDQALHHLHTHIISDSPPDFLDALVIAPHKSVVMAGWLSDGGDLPINSRRAPWKPWFHHHAADAHGEELLPIEDYLFRYDRAAFWMGQYTLLRRPPPEKSWEIWSRAQATLPYRHPGLAFRIAFGWALTSKRLYRRLHKIPDEQIARTLLIQDCCVPFSQARGYLEEVQERYRIYPLWLCPARRAHTPQILSPHALECIDEMLVNVGLYGVPAPFSSAVAATRDLEERLPLYGGRKALYGHSYYTADRFWELYDHKSYEALRESAFAEGVFPSIEQKVLAN